MLLPTRKLLILLLLPVAALLFFPRESTGVLALAYDASLLLVAAVCVLLSPRRGQIEIERKLPEHLSLGATNQVGWEIRNLAATPLKFEMTEDIPETFQRETPQMTGIVRPRQIAEVRYEVIPTRRGLCEFGDIFFRWHTQLGLVVRQLCVHARDAVKVYPNVSSLATTSLPPNATAWRTSA